MRTLTLEMDDETFKKVKEMEQMLGPEVFADRLNSALRLMWMSLQVGEGPANRTVLHSTDGMGGRVMLDFIKKY